MPINTQHRQYQSLVPKWNKMSDVLAGQDAIKAKKTAYLPMPNANDKTKENEARYTNYLMRANFIEFTKDTLDKYTGQAFKTDPVLNTDSFFYYLKRNADGSGLSIYQLAQMAFTDLMSLGRCGLFVDYPQTNGEVSKADVENNNIRPFLRYYKTQSIINWQHRVVNGVTRLSMVILAESVLERGDDEFEQVEINQFRYLGLDEAGRYFAEVWQEREVDGKTDIVPVGERVYPTYKGNYWSEIPFVVLGSDKNTFDEQSIPLESLANANLAHYRNSADYENSVFQVGQVQPYMTNVSDQRLRFYEDKGLVIGSGSCIMLEQGGSFGFAQAGPNMIAYEAMNDKKELMRELGAKLAESRGNKTATQADNDASAQTSVASMCIANINEAFDTALRYAYLYAGIEPGDGYLFKAKQDLIANKPDPTLIQSLAGLVQSGLAPMTVIYDYLRNHNIIDSEMTNEEIAELIEGGLINLGEGLDA